MKGLLAIVRWEFLFHLRTLRSRAAIATYIAACCLPILLLFFLDSGKVISSAVFQQALVYFQPFLTALLAAILAGNRSDARSQELMWSVLGSARMSGVRYLIGRWLGAAGLTLAASIPPPLLFAAYCETAGLPVSEPSAWLDAWLVFVVPLAVFFSAAWLGATTLTGSEIGALAFLWLGEKALRTLLNYVLAEFRYHVDGPVAWLQWESFRAGVRNLRLSFYYIDQMESFVATHAAWDGRVAREIWWPTSVLWMGASLCLLGVSTLWVLRTRRDLRPRPVRDDHPLRTYLPMLHRFRQRIVPCAAPSRVDVAAACVGILCAVLALGVVLHRQDQALASARVQYAAETEDLIAPMDKALQPLAWTVSGSLDYDGIDVEVLTELHNSGETPLALLAFGLNAQVGVDALEIAEAEGRESRENHGRSVRLHRVFDRIEVRLDPPLEAGRSVTLRWRLSGEPSLVDYSFWYLAPPSFVGQFDRYLGAKFARDLSDLSTTRPLRSISPSWTRLHATALMPTPRYTPWTHVMIDDGRNVYPVVPGEKDLRKTELTIDLDLPADLALADVCGHLSLPRESLPRESLPREAGEAGERADRAEMRGTCEEVLFEYEINGGRGREILTAAVGQGEITFLALPEHVENAQEYLDQTAGAARLIEGLGENAQFLGGLDSIVILERTPAFSLDRRLSGSNADFRLRGMLLTVDEFSLLRGPHRGLEGFYSTGSLPTSETLVAQILARRIVDRRPSEEGQRLLLRRLFTALMNHRMGVSLQKDARVSIRPEMKPRLETALLEFTETAAFDVNWKARLPATLYDLEHRLGAETLLAGVFAYAQGEGEGNLAELFTHWEELSGTDLDVFYQDFFADHRLPELELVEVTSQAEGDLFMVRGKVRNHADGRVFCPVIVRTEVSTQKTIVAVGGEGGETPSDTPFLLRVSSRPQSVALDPEGTCLRYMWGLASELEEKRF